MTLALVVVAGWVAVSVLAALVAGPLMAACDRPAPGRSQPHALAPASTRGSSPRDPQVSLRGGCPALAPIAGGRTEAFQLPA